MELCMQKLCSLVVLAILYLPIFVDGSSNDVLVVKQPERLTAELGGSVTINCTFEADYNTYSVTWFLGCENKSYLLDLPWYKHRVRFDNKKRQLIIFNLTESDSGVYCCNVEVANGKKGAGNGTQVEVKQRQCKTDGHDKHILLVEQPGLLRAEAGGSVSINCNFEAESNSYSVTWSMSCKNKSDIRNYPCYKHRVKMSSISRQITIFNLVEKDSRTYYCHVELPNGRQGTGNGTSLEVTRKQCQEDGRKQETRPCVIQYYVEGFEACLIILLIVLVIKLYHGISADKKPSEVLASSTNTCHPDRGTEEMDIHYAEINKERLSSHPRNRHNDITYASVKMHY